MKTNFSFRHAIALVIAGLVFLSGSSAHACSACYANNAGSKMGDAATIGIIAMTILMFAMLGAVAAFGFYLNYRAKHPLPDYNELLGTENPGNSAS